MNLLTVNGLSKRFGARAVLQNVSFSVRQGEVLGLIGPNGAGKTTLFECLAGVLPYDSGDILVNGRPLRDDARGSRIFYMPDGIVPWPSETVRWALDFAVGFFGGPPTAIPGVVSR